MNMQLDQILESEEYSEYMTENDEILEAAKDCILEFPKSLKKYILENLNDFIVPGNLAATEQNIVEFVQGGTHQFIYEIVQQLKGNNLEE